MFNICIIGCGDMGNQHASAWRARNDCRIVAVHDPDESRQKKMADSTGAVACATAAEALVYDGVDIVSVCTPVCFHCEIAVAAAKLGRHILCEKPIALTLAQADEMIQAAARHNVLLAVSLQYRSTSRQVKLAQLVHENAFGAPIIMRLLDIREVRPKLAMHRRSMNGGPIIDMAAHWFDLMRCFTRCEPIEIVARGHIFGRGKTRLASIPADDLAIDTATIEITYEQGHQLACLLNWGMPEGFKEIGDQLIVGPNLCARTTAEGLELRHPDGKIETWPAPPDPTGPSARIADLLAAIKGERPLEVTPQDARASLQCSLAALQSIKENRPIPLT